MLKNLKPNNLNVEKYLNQILDDPEYYMESDYNAYKDELGFELGYEPLFIEWSIISHQSNSDFDAIPLKDGTYYISASSYSPLNSGDILSSDEVFEYLNQVKDEYEYRGYEYYYYI